MLSPVGVLMRRPPASPPMMRVTRLLQVVGLLGVVEPAHRLGQPGMPGERRGRRPPAASPPRAPRRSRPRRGARAAAAGWSGGRTGRRRARRPPGAARGRPARARTRRWSRRPRRAARVPECRCGALVTSRQSPGWPPRPTRPRSWCSCETPNRSASSTTIIVAFATSTPTSITVVDTSTSMSPAANARITSSLRSAAIRPCSISTRSPCSAPSASSGATSSTAAIDGASSPFVRLGAFALAAADARADDVDLVALADLLADALIGTLEPGRLLGERDDVGLHPRAAGRQLRERGGLQVAEDRHRDGARDRRRRHHQHVRRCGVALGGQRRSLLHAEAVLLVDDDEAEVGELHLLLEQRVRADDDAGGSRGRVEHRLAARGGARASR